ncbi:Golgi GDP-mannose transporter [Rasamsonia emersonii CBS 393.64]|uniref:GDP-mannose transporter n=1 Tax=Rasamsonia emersonii (strain ATCC 16479 / CBS 393.64 / IMI 116815) TaxID=1408163 RepID=A0A0F4YUC5_RASE3|nr:Golgi GDP-mannose transporter [Rasamsonia emersonii CBS 393.64]KKA21839.1 Golgi GDP-mannose transporter [Rasamsonia emersonii CBS 393.64]
MAEGKKTDDYTVEMSKLDQGSKNFEPASVPAPRSSFSSSSLANNPILPVLAYCGSSILMTVMNKYVLSGLDFNLNFFLLCVQNLTIILIAYGEVLWFGGSVTGLTLFSFGLMVLSSIIAAWADIKHAVETSIDATAKVSTLNAGYIWMLINCLCTSSYVLGMRKRIKLTNFKDFDTMFYNNLLSIPVLIVFSLVVEDWSSENVNRNFPPADRTNIFMAMVLSGLSSVFISYTSAWCVRVTSSTTYSMVGALNKLPIALSGLIFFDAPVTVPSVSAIVVGFISGVVYAIAKVKQNAKPKTGILPTTNPPVPVSASSQSMRDSLRS